MHKNIIQQIAQATQLATQNVENTIHLLSEDASIPFIARYRKDQTGNLDENQIIAIKKLWEEQKTLAKRKTFILKNLEEQKKLSDELKQKIEACTSLVYLEDLYLPFKQKRKTKAEMARQKGLEPLAKMLMAQQQNNIHQLAQGFVKNEVKTTEDALAGARYIIAEWVNERLSARNKIRQLFERNAIVSVKQKAKADEEKVKKYKAYTSFSQKAKRCKSHQILAIFRGEKENILSVNIAPAEEDALVILEKIFLKNHSESTQQIKIALTDAYKRLLKPSLETELRQQLKLSADKVAIEVFAENLRELLLSPPIGEKQLLAIDPGFKSGCKMVALNKKGDFLDYKTIFPHPPQSQSIKASEDILAFINRYQIEAIAIGNGTAGRETEQFIKNLHLNENIKIYLVNEDGASIYSASKVAQEEFPNKDLTVRGAISIGRRLLDPLAELVKIDPKAIGVGQYQYDVNQKELKNSLDTVVISCVNAVGVNVNTASKYILTYVSGLGETLAQNIIDYRRKNKGISSRNELKKVARMGTKSFEQSIGFLRVENPKNPLDNSAVHPENYALVQQIAKNLNCEIKDLLNNTEWIKTIDYALYKQLVGEHTFKDILNELQKPNRDPRGESQSFEFADIKSINDLHEGMILPCIVSNVTNFGAFVDLGIKQNGLIHISNLSTTFVSNPTDIVKVNQKLMAKVIEIDIERNRIAMSLVF